MHIFKCQIEFPFAKLSNLSEAIRGGQAVLLNVKHMLVFVGSGSACLVGTMVCKPGRKSFCKTSFQVGMDLKKYKNKARTKTCEKITLLQNNDGKERPGDYPTSASSCLLVYTFVYTI